MGDNVSFVKAENCSGCALCFAICPRKAITMRYNEEGFFYPVVDEKKCNRCGLCYEKCPFRKIINRNNYRHPESWSCWHKSEQVVMASSSGGAFTALAEEILSRKGIIYGASYNPDLSVSHVRIPSKDSLSVVKKSKYIQSDISRIYGEVEKDLRAGKNVLFVGTPCQIAGLYGFFGNNPAGLYTCDLVCHGVNSLAVFKAYLSYTGKRLRHSIESVDFRVKIPSWEVPSVGLYYRGGENIVKVNEDPFYRGFLHNYYLRLSCYNCRYNTLPRIGDITLGDFWCWDKRYRPENFNPKGTSLVIINNDKGKELFLKVSKDKLNVAIADLYKTVLYNPFIKTCAEYPHDFFKRKEIFSLVRQHKYRELFGKQLSPRYKLKDRMRKYLRLYKEKLVKLKR